MSRRKVRCLFSRKDDCPLAVLKSSGGGRLPLFLTGLSMLRDGDGTPTVEFGEPKLFCASELLRSNMFDRFKLSLLLFSDEVDVICRRSLYLPLTALSLLEDVFSYSRILFRLEVELLSTKSGEFSRPRHVLRLFNSALW